MDQVTRKSCESLPDRVCELGAPREEPADSRTLLKRYLLDPVLPVFTVLAIGALVVVMLLLVVTAVGDMEQVLCGGSAAYDPWSCAATSTSPQAYAADVTSADAAPERSLWAGPTRDESADDPTARDATQR